jgi:heat shock protein HslJ
MVPFQALAGLAAAAGLALTLAACNGAGSPSAVTPPVAVGGDGASGGAAQSPLLGGWRLASVQPPGEPRRGAPAGTTFTVEFGSDGLVRAQADCNRCFSGYTAGAGTISVGEMACTRAYCGASTPLDTQFQAALSSARSWQAGGAALELRGDAGTLTLER